MAAPNTPPNPPTKKNGLWAVLLATSFFAIVFWLVWFVGKVVEKASDAYAAWQIRRRVPPAGSAPPAEAVAAPPADAARAKKDD